jgi:hypothetical protein
MVINCSVAGWDLHKVLVDNGSQANIIFLHAFDRMGVTPQCHLGFFPKLTQPIITCKFSKRVNIKRKFRAKVYIKSS